jgi:uncharacterized membrane protein
MNALGKLRVVKAAHTAVWALFAACILAIPMYVYQDRFDRVVVLIAIVLVEVAVLLLNSWRCPLTAVAARYTDDRRDNFDIYLPNWLARHNKSIFSLIFIAGLAYALLRWRAVSS